MSPAKRLWNHLRRGPFQTLAAGLVMFFVFLTVTTFLFLIITLSSAVTYFESRPEITAFVKDGVVQTQVDALISELKSDPQVEKVRYVSKEEALKIYNDLNKDNPLLLEMVTADILPASVEISAKSSEGLGEIASKMEKKSNLFEEVVVPRDVIDFLVKLTGTVKVIGFSIIGFLSALSLVIISVIVGMKVALFKPEIEILRLLGASAIYIQLPFLLEGFLYGLMGSFLGAGVLSGLAFIFQKDLMALLAAFSIPVPPLEIFLIAVGAEVAFGALVGLLASFLAVRKHIE